MSGFPFVAAAWADSVARTAAIAGGGVAAAGPIEGLREFREFVASWHEFYLLAGTGAVTLAGLLFVAMALHIETLLLDRFKALLVVARTTLGTFVNVLIVSLMMLTPEPTPPMIGTMLMVFTGVFLSLTIGEIRGAFGHDHVDFSRRQLRRRLLFPLAGYVGIMIVGAFVLLQAYEMLYLMVSVVSMLLANAVWSSWDLLVRVGRAKDREKREQVTSASR